MPQPRPLVNAFHAALNWIEHASPDEIAANVPAAFYPSYCAPLGAHKLGFEIGRDRLLNRVEALKPDAGRSG
jgi:hypothetical protein